MKTLALWFWHLVPGNPIAVQTVMGGSRRVRHQAARTGYLGLLVMLMVFGLLGGGAMRGSMSLTDLAKAGAWVFRLISYGQVVMVCLLAPLFMGAAIGQAQAGKTQDILLTTPLSNMQIVLGTLLGRLFFILVLLLSGLPLFAVLKVFGGVPVRAVFVSFAVAALSAMVVGTFAVALAVSRVAGRRVVFWFVIAVAGYLTAAYALDHLLLRRVLSTAQGQTTTWLTPLHPLLVLEASINSATYRTPEPEALAGYPRVVAMFLARPFEAFAVISCGVGAVLMLYSAVVVRWVSGLEGGLRSWLTTPWRLLRGAAGDRRRKPRRVWSNPIAWREARGFGRTPAGVLIRLLLPAVGVGLGAVLLYLYHHGRMPAVAGRLAGSTLRPDQVMKLALTTLLLTEVAVIVLITIYLSAGSVSREREEGTLDLILTTPITPRMYIWGKLRGLVTFAVWLLAVPVLTLAMVSLYAAAGERLGWPGASVSQIWIDASGVSRTRTEALMLLAAPLMLLAVVVPFTAFCVTLGMSWSLRAKSVLSAVVPSVLVVGGVTLVTGFFGYHAVGRLPLVGPVINAFCPVTHLVVITDPWAHVASYGRDPAAGGLSLLAGSVIAGCGYCVVVYLMLQSMVQGFDQTVRRLSGTG